MATRLQFGLIYFYFNILILLCAFNRHQTTIQSSPVYYVLCMALSIGKKLNSTVEELNITPMEPLTSKKNRTVRFLWSGL